MSQSFDLPVDVPWYPIAASPDMMDMQFGTGFFPPPWRSSLAIFAYEPSPDDLPSEMCNQKITYLKVSCSVTGYQPTAQETADLVAAPPPENYNPSTVDYNPAPIEVGLPTAPGGAVQDNLSDALDYADASFGCYGVLLNVAVFPSTTTVVETSGATITKTFTYRAVGAPFPNPYSTGGLTFSTPAGGPIRRHAFFTRSRHGFIVPARGLQIDLPMCTDVVLQMLVGNDSSGIITAYQGSAPVFGTSIPTASTSPQSVSISAAGPITQIVIRAHGDNCYLVGITYDDAERSVTIADYPHIVDFEPKSRDLYQGATDQDEISNRLQFERQRREIDDERVVIADGAWLKRGRLVRRSIGHW